MRRAIALAVGALAVSAATRAAADCGVERPSDPGGYAGYLYPTDVDSFPTKEGHFRIWWAKSGVHAPLLAPSLATAALLVFVDVMKELPASFALRPFNFDTLAITAYNLAKDERLAEAALPSLMIVAAGLLPLAVVTRRYLRGQGG